MWKKRRKLASGNSISEDLITPTDIAKMTVGQILVMIYGKYKYITTIPDFQMLYDYKPVATDKSIENKVFKTCELEVFDLVKYLTAKEFSIEEITRIEHTVSDNYD